MIAGQWCNAFAALQLGDDRARGCNCAHPGSRNDPRRRVEDSRVDCTHACPFLFSRDGAMPVVPGIAPLHPLLRSTVRRGTRLRHRAFASIDQQVDLEIAAASAASGSSFAATAAALPRPSTGNALNQPLPSKPKVSLPGCGPLPGNEGTSRASFAATARRSVIQRRSTDEYMLGDSSFMTVASAAPRDAAHVEAGRGSTSTRKSVSSTAAEARRKSVAELAESRKSLVEVMQMYGPDEEEAADVKVNRTSLSGWYTDEKDKPEDEAAAARERSLSSWYASEQERRVSVDPAKVVSLKEDGGGEVTVPSGVAHNLTEEATAAASEETATSAQGAAQ
eukprot:s5101_g7.t1